MEILLTIYIVGASLAVGGAMMLTLLLGMFTGTVGWKILLAGVGWGLIWPLSVSWGICYTIYQDVRRK